MATNTWNSTGSADWNTGSDWSAGAPPAPGDNVVIDEGIALIDAADGLIEIDGFTIDFGAGLTLDDGALTVTSDLDNAGTLSLDTQSGEGGSDLTVDGLFSNSGTLDIGGFDLLAASELSVGSFDNNGGTIDLTGAGSEDALIFIDDLDGVASLDGTTPGAVAGAVDLNGYQGGAVIEFLSGQITTIESDATLSLIGAGALIEDDSTTGSNSALLGLASNAGTLNIADGASVTTTVDFDNTGTVNLFNYDPGNSSLDIGGSLTNTDDINLYSAVDGSQVVLNVSGNATNDGTVSVGSQGLVTIDGNVSADSGHSGTFDIGVGGILSVGGNIDASQTIDFTNTGGVGGILILNALGDKAPTIGAHIDNFVAGDTIQIDGFQATSASYDAATGIYTLSDGTTTYQLDVGDQPPSSLGYTDNTTGGYTVITSDAPCFCRGTLIETPQGQLPVETLRIGDRVVTAEGRAVAVKWIGRRSLHPFFARIGHGMPIRIAEGALGDSLPRCDLYVSPDHAMLFQGCLVHAVALVNGHSITQMEAWDGAVEYFHIETEAHELILAEGAAAETFVDKAARQRFDNAAEFAELYPHAEPMIEMDLPRICFKRQLPRVMKQRLEAIADSLPGRWGAVARGGALEGA